MGGKFALVIGNTEYIDPGLAQLTAPGMDTEDFARVLKHPDICAFDQVTIFMNQLSSTVTEAIDAFFDQKKPDDLLVLYFSGHGVKDELGSLYLAVTNTFRSRLRSTAVRSDYIREAMDQSRSKRQVVILDCCNSGAFPQGTKTETGMGMVSALQGYGRFVLTASDATQFAWEGDKAIGATQNSLFTHFLVKGLEGEADRDSDGNITVDELYDYAYEQIARLTPKQTPTKSTSRQEGEIVLRQNMRLEDIRPLPLPSPLLDAIENPFAEIRLGAVQQLTQLARNKNLGLARSAREALEKIAAKDDSQRVVKASTQALESILQEERASREAARKARHEALRLAAEQEATRLRVAGESAKKAASERMDHSERQLPITSYPLKGLFPGRDLRKWARGVGIVGGLCVLGFVLVWLGSTVFPGLSPTVPIQSSSIAQIPTAFTITPTTQEFTATSPNISATTSIPCFHLLTPGSGSELQSIGNINFTWETMPGATRYRLEIIVPDGTVIPIDTENSSYIFPADSIPSAGTYRWGVTAYDANRAILCLAGPFSFTKPEHLLPTKGNNASNPNSPMPRDSTFTFTASVTPSWTPSLTNTPTIPTTEPPTPTTPAPSPCGQLPTRVSPGITIRVLTPSIGIRPQPDTDAHRMFQLFQGDQMTVLAGPECADDSYFWYITSQQGDGWVREGNNSVYFVEPVQ
jgi:hypothetical protein